MKYQLITKIDIQHRYYSSGYCPNIEIVPTIETKRTLQRNKMKLRLLNHQYCLYAEQGEEETVEENIKCAFVIKIKDPLFINFTALPLTTTKYYFHSDSEEQQLSQNQYVSEADQVSFYPKKFNYSLTPKETVGMLMVKDKKGEQVDQQEITASASTAIIDIEHLAEGCYMVYRDGEVLIPQFYAGQDLDLTDLGMIEIESNPSKLLKENSIVSYSIIFDNRATFWRYYLINSHNYTLGNFQIKTYGKENNNIFLASDDIKLANGTIAQTLISEQPIPLKQTYDTTFRLSMNKMLHQQASGITSNIDLPVADIAMIKPIKQADGSIQMISDIYVYL